MEPSMGSGPLGVPRRSSSIFLRSSSPRKERKSNPSRWSSAAEYPKVQFAAVDFELAGDNVASIVYREQEGDFLIGVLAAMLTTTETMAKRMGVLVSSRA